MDDSKQPQHAFTATQRHFHECAELLSSAMQTAARVAVLSSIGGGVIMPRQSDVGPSGVLDAVALAWGHFEEHVAEHASPLLCRRLRAALGDLKERAEGAQKVAEQKLAAWIASGLPEAARAAGSQERSLAVQLRREGDGFAAAPTVAAPEATASPDETSADEVRKKAKKLNRLQLKVWFLVTAESMRQADVQERILEEFGKVISPSSITRWVQGVDAALFGQKIDRRRGRGRAVVTQRMDPQLMQDLFAGAQDGATLEHFDED